MYRPNRIGPYPALTALQSTPAEFGPGSDYDRDSLTWNSYDQGILSSQFNPVPMSFNDYAKDYASIHFVNQFGRNLQSKHILPLCYVFNPDIITKMPLDGCLVYLWGYLQCTVSEFYAPWIGRLGGKINTTGVPKDGQVEPLKRSSIAVTPHWMPSFDHDAKVGISFSQQFILKPRFSDSVSGWPLCFGVTIVNSSTSVQVCNLRGALGYHIYTDDKQVFDPNL